MLNTLFNFESDSTFELIPALNGTFSYHDVMKFDISNYISNFISCELKWRLLDSFVTLHECKNIKSDEKFKQSLDEFVEFSKKDVAFEGEELRDLFKISIKFKINSFFQPINLIINSLFSNNYVIAEQELLVKADYFEKTSPAGVILNEFVDTNKDLDIIQKFQFVRFAKEYSNKLISNPSVFESIFNSTKNYLEECNIKFTLNYLQILLNDLKLTLLSHSLSSSYTNDDVISYNDILRFFEYNIAETVSDYYEDINDFEKIDEKMTGVNAPMELNEEELRVIEEVNNFEENLESIESNSDDKINNLITENIIIDEPEIDNIKNESKTDDHSIDLNKYLENDFSDLNKSDVNSDKFDLKYALGSHIKSILMEVNS